MKKLLSVAVLLIITSQLYGQSPEKMSYQAVVRDASNQLITNSTIGMQISILQSSVSGIAVYIEKHNPTTNENGLATVEIGGGNIVAGSFTGIDWEDGPYFIKTETDPIGGTVYTISGTTQLMSVPYALHAKTAESITGSINYTETDPTFNAWDKSTGIVITESQISDLTHTVDTDTQLSEAEVDAYVANNGYINAETDPSFSAWNKSTGIVITESQISDLTHTVDTDTQLSEAEVDAYVANNGYINAETDPTFSAWDKSTGIVITESQISDLTHTVDTDTQLSEAEVDAYVANNGYINAETDPTFNAWNKSTGIVITESQISDLTHTVDTDTQLSEAEVDAYVANNGYLTSEIDGSVTNELQTLTVSEVGDTLTINGGNSVIIPGISLANHPPAQVGDYRHGGIVFWLDGNGGGLVVALENQSTWAEWGCSGTDITGADGTDLGDGEVNTAVITFNCTTPGIAADICKNLTLNGYSDWFLPSRDELLEIANNYTVINNAILLNSGEGLNGDFWSSSNTAGHFAFKVAIPGTAEIQTKGLGFNVRAIRSF